MQHTLAATALDVLTVHVGYIRAVTRLPAPEGLDTPGPPLRPPLRARRSETTAPAPPLRADRSETTAPAPPLRVRCSGTRDLCWRRLLQDQRSLPLLAMRRLLGILLVLAAALTLATAVVKGGKADKNRNRKSGPTNPFKNVRDVANNVVPPYIAAVGR